MKKKWINQRWFRWKNHDKFCRIKSKNWQLLKDDDSEDEKVKGTKKCVIKGKLKFKSYENCLKVNQYSNKIKNLEKNKIGIDSIRKIRMNLYETIN